MFESRLKKCFSAYDLFSYEILRKEFKKCKKKRKIKKINITKRHNLFGKIVEQTFMYKKSNIFI